MKIIGRKREQEVLTYCSNSEKPEFLVVYGRRRVGKTFLIKEFFNNEFAFYATGVNNVGTKEQLGYFYESLREYGSVEGEVPKTWREAFSRLKSLISDPNVKKDPASGKIVIFLDEVPWMDTAKSGFKPALDYFWNSFASSQKDIFLIVCGSATSYIIKNIIGDKGGFYNRITNSIRLMPFTLKECEEFYISNGVSINRYEIIQSYMVFGGIPYYLNLINRRMSLAQNIEALLFNPTGQLYYEYDRLFSSLFRNPGKHILIIEALSGKGIGMTRKEIIEDTSISDGELLSVALEELEHSGFIRKYKNYTKKKTEGYYQIIDPFVLFHNKIIAKDKASSWIRYVGSPSYNAWSGNSFEIVCLIHTDIIKQALGIAGIESVEYSWRSQTSEPGAQIDLLIDRTDNCINICEVKYSGSPYVIDPAYEKKLRYKIECFRKETKTEKSLFLTMITANGLKHNAHSGVVINELTADDLFSL